MTHPGVVDHPMDVKKCYPSARSVLLPMIPVAPCVVARRDSSLPHATHNVGSGKLEQRPL